MTLVKVCTLYVVSPIIMNLLMILILNLVSWLQILVVSVITRKMVPITGRASSFLVFLEFSTKSNRVEGRQNNRPINLPKVLHRQQVHYLTLFIIHNKHMNTIFIYTCIYIHTYMNCSSQLY